MVSISALVYHGLVVWRPLVVHQLDPAVVVAVDDDDVAASPVPATVTTFRLPWLLW